jgi:hypothetical protein
MTNDKPLQAALGREHLAASSRSSHDGPRPALHSSRPPRFLCCVAAATPTRQAARPGGTAAPGPGGTGRATRRPRPSNTTCRAARARVRAGPADGASRVPYHWKCSRKSRAGRGPDTPLREQGAPLPPGPAAAPSARVAGRLEAGPGASGPGNGRHGRHGRRGCGPCHVAWPCHGPCIHDSRTRIAPALVLVAGRP